MPRELKSELRITFKYWNKNRNIHHRRIFPSQNITLKFEDRKGTFSPWQIVKPRTSPALFISSSCKSLFGSFHAQTRVPDFCRPQRNSICEQPKHSKYIDVSPRNSSHEDIMNISAGDLTSGRVKYIFTLAYRS